MKKKEFVCKFCNKKFPSGKSLGGHIRIHSPRSSLDFNAMKKNNKKRSVDQREITPPPKHQQQCRVCRKSFCSQKALANHMDCHNDEVGEEMVMDTHQSASETTTTTSSGPTKRSKKQYSSSDESYSIVRGAKDLMFCHLGRKDYNFAVAPDSSENNSELSSGELLLKTTDKVSVDVDDDSDDEGASDSDSSDDDYFLNGPKKSDSDISFGGGSLGNTGVGGSGFNSFSNGDDEVRNKEGGGSKHHELGKSKRVWSEEGMAAKKASGANGNSRGHECPVCFKVYGSGQALGGHKRHCRQPRTEEEDQTHKAAADMDK